MTNILFFNTETTGLADFNKRARDPSQPHIVQLACALTMDCGTVLESHNMLVKPDGWTIPIEASDVHGITDEVAAVGLPEKQVASIFLEMIKKSSLLVAHNLMFDKFIARIAMRRYDLITDAEDVWWKALPAFCTMLETTELCQLPGKIAGKYKWPKLHEAHYRIFGKEFEGAHDALADVTACSDIYFWLRDFRSQPPAIKH